ncbi:MAG: SDR family oxidoreductase [Eubacteriales bacterium]|nr:SDR family oxidoreductase [Eubacteriales bacterium]
MKTALITGATVNTGLGVAQKFAAEGWNVIITSRRSEALPGAIEKIRSKNENVQVLGYALELVSADNSVNERGIGEMFADIDARGLSVDCLVLNAANLGIRQQIFQNPLSDFMNVINTNIVANYCLVEHAARRMAERRDGSVVFINSNTAYRAIPDRIAYSASKSGQLGMMRALALDLGKYNIRVNAVLPGMIKTDRWENNYNNCREALSNYTPLGDIAEFSDIADAVWYFAAHARNTTGAELTVDGGNMIQLYPIVPGND